jgi:hypothetical protein
VYVNLFFSYIIIRIYIYIHIYIYIYIYTDLTEKVRGADGNKTGRAGRE